MRTKQVDKRAAKLKGLLKDIPAPKLYGPEKAEVTIMCWGSHKMPAIDAIPMLEKEGVKANVVHFTHLYPLDQKKIESVLKDSKKTVMIENNSTGQFTGMLKEYCSIEPDFLMLKYDGRQFFAEQITEEIGKLVKGGFKSEREIRICEKEDLEYYNPQRHGL
jgi:2-oxoglutarate ferredoxin oxidoreductase subunit alpha